MDKNQQKTRKPVARGFYPLNKEELEKKIDKLLKSVPERNINPKGIIVPHAGYEYSGKTAAHAYKSLKDRKIENAVILGFNHSGIGEKAALSTLPWETPLGKTEVNREIKEKILENEVIKADESAHSQEHSIEVQLPFLQFLNPEIEITPISLSNKISIEEIKKISETLKKIDYKKNILIASSDLLHVGYRFNLVPEEDNLEYLNKKDEEFINSIKDLKIQEIIEKGRKSTVCGFIPIAVVLDTLKDQIKEIKVLERSNSYEVTGDKSSVVGYASIALT